MRVQNPNTAAPGTNHEFTGWCLDKEDLCVAKLCANRQKDRNFVTALLDASLVDPALIAERLPTVEPQRHPQADAALDWLGGWRASRAGD